MSEERTSFNISPTVEEEVMTGEFPKQVRVPGVVVEDVRVTAAGTFKISEKVGVPVKVGEDEESVATAAGIFYISKKVCVDDKKEEKKSLKILLEEDELQPEVCMEEEIKKDVSDESKMVTIKRNWNTGVVTFIRPAKIEPDDANDDEVVFVEEIIKSK